jgi:hypothetical protein
MLNCYAVPQISKPENTATGVLPGYQACCATGSFCPPPGPRGSTLSSHNSLTAYAVPSRMKTYANWSHLGLCHTCHVLRGRGLWSGNP